jgi:D-alanyl-D-alanine carboxypeptidase
VTIRRLLNMTSGIPGYDTVPAMLEDYAKDPTHHLTIPQLIAYVYPGQPHAPPPTTGYDYSNTNYLLAELIIERVSGNSYSSELESRFFNSNIGLKSSYYAGKQYPANVLDRMVSGYFFSHDPDNAGLAPLLGRDVSRYSVSWMKAAGAIVSTPEDLTRWARALYTGPMLAAKQRAELKELVSTKTGNPIAATSLSDPRGFGLGIAQLTTPQTGTVWFYEGMTLGYRMVHLYFPRQDAVIAFGMNSQPDSKENSSAKFAVTIYETLHAAGRL